MSIYVNNNKKNNHLCKIISYIIISLRMIGGMEKALFYEGILF